MIFMLCGTSDARELAVQIKQSGLTLLTSVVTENAAKSLQDAGLDARTGRLTEEQMAQLLTSGGYRALVDASHPFAEEGASQCNCGGEACRHSIHPV